jgi:hypothetical protein
VTDESVQVRGKHGDHLIITRGVNSRNLHWGIVAAGIAAVLAACAAQLTQHPSEPAIQVGESDLGGVVTGPQGPEAGVWVIAETTELPTRYTKIVVTDDRGRYVLPGLPKANYSVGCADTGWWIRPSPERPADPRSQSP